MSVLSVSLSVCSARAFNSKTKRRRKNKEIGLTVTQGRSNRCANVQFRRSKVNAIRRTKTETSHVIALFGIHVWVAAQVPEPSVAYHVGTRRLQLFFFHDNLYTNAINSDSPSWLPVNYCPYIVYVNYTRVSALYLMHRVAQKLAPFLYTLNLPNINRFSKSFHCQNQEKFVIMLSLKIPPHLKCVATLPCEMSVS